MRATGDAPHKQVWDQFVQLCQASTHIIVLGHSLHDKHLVDALRAPEKPVAIIVYATNYDAEGFDDKTHEFATKFSTLLPDAVCIPGRFGGESEGSDIEPHKLGEWLRINAP